MFIEERHQDIVKILETEGRITVNDIQEKYDISFDSARRDLRILEQKGLLKRTHGGAILYKPVGYALPYKITPHDITVIKDNYWAIAQKAITYIKAEQVIFLTSGSVGFYMVKNLPTDISYTVAVNSIILAEELRNYNNIIVYLIGGQMSQKGLTGDSLATSFVKNMRFDISFITATGLSTAFGMSIQNPEAVAFYQELMNSTKMKIALFPNEKIGFESVLTICPVNAFDLLITDWDALDEEINRMEKLGVEIVIADKDIK